MTTRKIASALAVAAAMTAGSAQAVTFQVDENTEFEVNMGVEFFYATTEEFEVDDRGGGDVRKGTTDVTEFGDDDSELDITGRHTFTTANFGEVTAYFDTEFNFEADDDDGGAGPGIADTEEANIGLASSRFGEVTFGKWDSYYDDEIQDHHDIFEVIDVSDPTQTDWEDAVGYTTPEFSLGVGTFQLMGGVSLRGDADSDQLGFDGDSSEEAFQVAAVYRYDRLRLAVGYDDLGTEFRDSDGLFGFSGTLDLAPFTFTVRAEKQGDSGREFASGQELDDDVTFVGLAATYDYGRGELLAAVHSINEGDDFTVNLNDDGTVATYSDGTRVLDGGREGEDRTEFLVGANFVVGNGFELYAESRFADKKNDVDDTTLVGVAYGF